MSFLDELRARRKKLADVLADDEYSGIRQIVEDLYPDKAHFIYELLQNAEDTGATEVNFILKKEVLVFEHNGRPFNEKDIEAITNIGKGTKGDQEDKIGRFGIGFKAVFAYTESPKIWSPTYSFSITNLVLPEENPPCDLPDGKTRFEFPFNNPKKSCESAYSEIASGLTDLSETALLFLVSIRKIGWMIGDNISGEILRVPHSDHHVEVHKRSANNPSIHCHFLLYSKPIEVQGRPIQNVSVAFLLGFLPNITVFDSSVPLSRQMKIIPAIPGRVAVFFPAKKEASGLRFHLHAPFVPELSRASIKETPANDPLFNMLADLAASSLHEIKHLGLLSGEFLSVLPNPQDALTSRYVQIREKIIDEMNNKHLTPTIYKTHAPAKTLLQARASLKELLSEEDLEFLIDYDEEPPSWAIAATQRNSNQDRFIAGLEITTWDCDQFIDLLKGKAHEKKYSYENGPDEQFMDWLSKKSVEWHQQMYAFLYNEITSKSEYYQNQYFEVLRFTKLVRLSDGTYSTGICYFPSNGIEHDIILPRVNRLTYESGEKKNQKEAARKFLEAIGVREVGDEEEIVGILKARYRKENFAPTLEDLPLFIKFLDKHPDEADIFIKEFIFKKINDQWGWPSTVYLDSPYCETGLCTYFDALEDNLAPKALSSEYLNGFVDIKKFVNFARAVGVRHKLPISKDSCQNNPQWSSHLCLVSGTHYSSPIDEDYKIVGLEKIIRHPSLELSKLIWRTMCELDNRFLQATYQKNRTHGPRKAHSQLVHLLKDAEWVPQANGIFVRPCDASQDFLPEDFPFNKDQEWLQCVDFGMTAERRSEEYRVRNEQARLIGFHSVDEANKMAELAKLLRSSGTTPEDLINRYKPVINKGEKAFPVRKIHSADRRQEQIYIQIKNAKDKEYEKSNRSVRTTQGSIDQYTWLRNQYTNDMDQMICQICKEEMPFRKRNGQYYFEAVEVLSRDHFPKEHEAQYIALCPLCAAMFTEFIKRDQDAMMTFKKALQSSDEPEISLQLGDTARSIRFVETHYHDIKEILGDIE